MRVLITVAPTPAHLHQLVPLAWALRTAGQEVRVAGPPEFTETINSTGLVAVAAGTVADLTEHIGLWRPDLVVWDGGATEGPVAARAAGAVSVRVLGMMAPGGQGGAEDADLTLDLLPPSLRDTADGAESTGHRSVRYIPYAGPSVVPSWLRRKPRRQRVLLTGGGPAVAATLAGIGTVAAEVVCAADQVPPDASPPDNVRLVDDVALTAALPSCSAVVHDGAALPVATAMAAGLPQLGLTTGAAVPWPFDRVVSRGAGVSVAPDPAALGEHVTRLLTEAAPRRRAELLRDELAAMPSPHDVVPVLLELAARRAAGV